MLAECAAGRAYDKALLTQQQHVDAKQLNFPVSDYASVADRTVCQAAAAAADAMRSVKTSASTQDPALQLKHLYMTMQSLTNPVVSSPVLKHHKQTEAQASLEQRGTRLSSNSVMKSRLGQRWGETQGL